MFEPAPIPGSRAGIGRSYSWRWPRSRQQSWHGGLPNAGDRIGHVRNAKAILARRLLRNVVDKVTLVLGPIPKAFSHQLVDPPQAVWTEVGSTNDAKAIACDRFLNDLQLSQAGNVQSKILRQRDA